MSAPITSYPRIIVNIPCSQSYPVICAILFVISYKIKRCHVAPDSYFVINS